MLPNLICPGASKSGTTTLYDILKEHPQVYTGTIKEPHFFDTAAYEKGLEYYERSYYPNGGNARVVTDFSPSYMQDPLIAGKLRQCLGDGIKIIIMLRNPIDRAFSAYQFEKQRGNEKTADFGIVLRESLEAAGGHGSKHIEDGLYCSQVKAYYDHFPKENIRLIIFEDFVRHMQESVDDITAFLGISPIVLGSDYHSNKTRTPASKVGKMYLTFRYNVQKYTLSLRKGRAAKWLPVGGAIRLVKRMERRVFDRGGPAQRLDAESRQILKTYYQEDVASLRLLSDLDLSAWVDFS